MNKEINIKEIDTILDMVNHIRLYQKIMNSGFKLYQIKPITKMITDDIIEHKIKGKINE
jgi:hypothetical protein